MPPFNAFAPLSDLLDTPVRDSMYTIYSIGSINIDQICWIQAEGAIGESVPIVKYERRIGGKGINQAEAVRRAGCPINFHGMVGIDSEWILYMLNDAGFPIENISKCSDEYTGQVIINHYESISAMNYYLGANSKISNDFIFKCLMRGAINDVLVVQNEIGNMLQVLRCAREKQMRICFNPSPRINAEWTANDYQCEWLIINEHEFNHLLLLFDCQVMNDTKSSMSKLRQKLSANSIVCTMGAKGAMAMHSGGQFVTETAPKVEVKDTVGAGDCFAGYFIASVVRAEAESFTSFKGAIKEAVMAASIKVQRFGAFEGIPHLNELDKR